MLSAGHSTVKCCLWLRQLLTILISVFLIPNPHHHHYPPPLGQHQQQQQRQRNYKNQQTVINSQPIPGVVYNPAFPPKNPRPNGTGLRPVVRPDTNSIADGDKDEDDYVNPNGNIPNRFGGDDDDDDRFVFDVEERTTTTRRPAAAAALRPFTQSRKATDK